MATEIIEFRDGLRVEVEALPAGKLRQTSTQSSLDAAIDQARDLLLKAVEPVTLRVCVWANFIVGIRLARTL